MNALGYMPAISRIKVLSNLVFLNKIKACLKQLHFHFFVLGFLESKFGGRMNQKVYTILTQFEGNQSIQFVITNNGDHVEKY